MFTKFVGGLVLTVLLWWVAGCATNRARTVSEADLTPQPRVESVAASMPPLQSGPSEYADDLNPFPTRLMDPTPPSTSPVSAEDKQLQNSDLLTFKPDAPVSFPGYRPNEILVGKFTISGVVVGPIKTGRPLQLLNPRAPAEFGTMEENTLHDWKTDRIIGTRIFSWGF